MMQVLEGIEGALADPATLATDPTMYAPDQERPSSAVVAQLRPLLSVARMPMGAELAEPNFGFSMMSKLHNKWRKAEHQAQEGSKVEHSKLGTVTNHPVVLLSNVIT